MKTELIKWTQELNTELMENGEHRFHTEEQMLFLDNRIRAHNIN